jgi:hypothetical protein
MGDLKAALEDYLAGLPQEEWRALCARVRPPDEPEIGGGPDDCLLKRQTSRSQGPSFLLAPPLRPQVSAIIRFFETVAQHRDSGSRSIYLPRKNGRKANENG